MREPLAPLVSMSTGVSHPAFSNTIVLDCNPRARGAADALGPPGRPRLQTKGRPLVPSGGGPGAL